MRDLVFRGKGSYYGPDGYHRNAWCEGSLILAEKYCCILQYEEALHPMDSPYMDGDLGTFDGKATPVDPETVGQYTGIDDKNGQKIFEGDILKVESGGIDEDDGPACVVWDEGTARFILEWRGFVSDFDSFYGNECEVIGNIYDNRDLINGHES